MGVNSMDPVDTVTLAHIEDGGTALYVDGRLVVSRDYLDPETVLGMLGIEYTSLYVDRDQARLKPFPASESDILWDGESPYEWGRRLNP